MYRAAGCRLQMTALGKNTALLIWVPVCKQIQSTMTILSYESMKIAHHVKWAADNSATVSFLCSKCKVCFLIPLHNAIIICQVSDLAEMRHAEGIWNLAGMKFYSSKLILSVFMIIS